MFKRLLVAVDNSQPAGHATEMSVAVARAFRAELTGCHVYAARLHDARFRQMEDGLPQRYGQGPALDRQRAVHDTLIERGLRLISTSYLDGLARRCAEADVPFRPLVLEGRNHVQLVRLLRRERYDLAVLGACGLGSDRWSEETAGPEPASGLLGSVCQRVVRGAPTSVLVVKGDIPLDAGPILVAIDGSAEALAALDAALALAQAFATPVEALAVFDPHFHRLAFGRLEGVLTGEAARLFHFREQRRLHDELIDGGLARIYRRHLDGAARRARSSGQPIGLTLLQGRPFAAITEHARRTGASLVAAGRLGVHREPGLELGSTAENLLRSVPCHVLLAARSTPHASRSDVSAPTGPSGNGQGPG